MASALSSVNVFGKGDENKGEKKYGASKPPALVKGEKRKSDVPAEEARDTKKALKVEPEAEPKPVPSPEKVLELIDEDAETVLLFAYTVEKVVERIEKITGKLDDIETMSDLGRLLNTTDKFDDIFSTLFRVENYEMLFFLMRCCVIDTERREVSEGFARLVIAYKEEFDELHLCMAAETHYKWEDDYVAITQHLIHEGMYGPLKLLLEHCSTFETQLAHMQELVQVCDYPDIYWDMVTLLVSRLPERFLTACIVNPFGRVKTILEFLLTKLVDDGHDCVLSCPPFTILMHLHRMLKTNKKPRIALESYMRSTRPLNECHLQLYRLMTGENF